jgi:hypothetical protein
MMQTEAEYLRAELIRCRDILAQARGLLDMVQPGGRTIHYCPTVQRVRDEARAFQETSRIYPKPADLEAVNGL